MGKFSKFFGAPRSSKLPSTDAGDRIYAIGDIHGRYDLFRALLNKIEAHAATLPPGKATHVILVGDLIDRGPDSAKVLKLVYNIQKQTRNMTALLGNHEELMVRALSGEPGMLNAWIKLGGGPTLRSFGLEVPKGTYDLREFTQQVAQAVPREWVNWLQSMPLSARSGDYFFCHAGVRPGVAIKKQSRNDLLWIREEFLSNEDDHGVVVVHGHSVSSEVELRSNRIGIDTGAYKTNMLTALYLEGTERDIISCSFAAGEEQLDTPRAMATSSDANAA
jgi:serine/threonine protein phosphatase 1